MLRPTIVVLALLLAAATLSGAPIQGTPDYAKSQALLAQGNYEGAVGALQPLLGDGETAAGAQLEIGRIRQKQAEGEFAAASAHFSDAAQALQTAVAAGSMPPAEAAKTLYDLARIYDERMGDLPRAMECYEKIITQHPSFLAIDKVLYYQAAGLEKMSRPEEAAKLYQKLVADHPYSSFQPVAQERLKAIAPGTSVAAAAIETQKQVADDAKTDEQAAQAQMDVAHMARENGDTKEAVAAYRKVVAATQNPELAKKAMAELAALLDEKQKDYKGAATVLEDMVKRYPTDEETGKSLYKLGRLYEENLNSRQKYIRDGRVYYRDSQESSEKAVSYYDQLTQSRPDADESADAYLRKAEIYESRLKDTDKAREEYERFLRYFPSHPDAEKAREKLKALGGE